MFKLFGNAPFSSELGLLHARDTFRCFEKLSNNARAACLRMRSIGPARAVASPVVALGAPIREPNGCLEIRVLEVHTASKARSISNEFLGISPSWEVDLLLWRCMQRVRCDRQFLQRFSIPFTFIRETVYSPAIHDHITAGIISNVLSRFLAEPKKDANVELERILVADTLLRPQPKT